MNLPRRRIGVNSVRARLLLWNVGIVALVLAAMGSLISYSVRAKLMASVERDLKEHADRAQPPPPPVNQRADADPGPPADQPAQDPRFPRYPGLPGDQQAQGPPYQRGPGPPAQRQMAPPQFPREPDGSLSVRIPRVFNPDGTGRPPFQDKGVWDKEAFEQSLQGREVFKTILIDDEPARLLSRPQWPRHGAAPRPGQPPPRYAAELPPRPGDRPLGVIQVIYPLEEINRSVGEMNATLLTLIPVALALAAAGGAWLTERALRPVRRITQMAAGIGVDDLRKRLPLIGGDEFEELAGTINGMLERLHAAFARMEVLVREQRRFTADASHELKTPLTVIKANSSLALATQPDLEGYHETVEEIDRAANGMNHLVQDLLLLARADEAQAGRNRERMEAGELLQNIAEQARRPGCAEIRFGQIDAAALRVNRDELTRALTNLAENALKHTPAGGLVTLSCQVGGSGVSLVVADTGVGIPSEHLPHLGERFYRADASRARSDGGSGLGLAICKSLVEANGGRLLISSQVGQGTTAMITLPAVE